MNNILPLFLFILSTVIIIVWPKGGRTTKLVTLMFFAIVINFYIRFGFERYFTAFDESYYLFLVSNKYFYPQWPFSGFTLPFILSRISNILNLSPLVTIVSFSLIMFTLYIPSIYWFYRKLDLPTNLALLSVLTLFISSYYIWGGMEVRPQLLGVLLGILLTAYYIDVLKNPKPRDFLILPTLFTVLALSHILSFFLYSVLLMLLTFQLFLSQKLSLEQFKRRYLLLSISILVGIILILWFPPYERMVDAIIWIVENMKFLSKFSFAFEHFKITTIGMYLMGIIVLWVLASPLSTWRKELNDAWSIIETLVRRLFIPVLSLAIIAWMTAIYVQFMLNADSYTSMYKNSPLVFLFFQAGNIFFGLVFIYAILSKIRDRKFSLPEILALLWILMGAVLLIFSMAMPTSSTGGWRFNNWLIRVLMYFPVFGAPVVTEILAEDFNRLQSKIHQTSVQWPQIIMVLLMTVLILVSVLNVSRPPQFYSYDVTINEEILDIARYCSSNNINFLTWENSSELRTFMTINIFRAYCPEARFVSWNSSYPYIVMSSDSFRVYSTDYLTSTFKALIQYSSYLIRTSGSETPDKEAELKYSTDLLGGIYSVSLANDLECQEILDSQEPLILIGADSNKCTQPLIKSGALPVIITSTEIRTPINTYVRPQSSDKWWDVEWGYFVIQIIQTPKNTPILVIAGTDVDSTIAGVWYFVNKIYPNITNDKYKNSHYIVGKWTESDHKVWNDLKFNPNDKNGFSPGDKIQIIEIG